MAFTISAPSTSWVVMPFCSEKPSVPDEGEPHVEPGDGAERHGPDHRFGLAAELSAREGDLQGGVEPGVGEDESGIGHDLNVALADQIAHDEGGRGPGLDHDPVPVADELGGGVGYAVLFLDPQLLALEML